ncbi:MAG: hypothetical protein V3U79_05245 [Dehalococcoidia bacterium]
MVESRAANTSETVYMRGGGYYGRVNRGTKQVISNALDLVGAAIEGIDVADNDRVFAIADYGAADGGTSYELVRNLIDMIRVKAPSHGGIIQKYASLDATGNRY